MKSPEQTAQFLESSIPRSEISTRDAGKGRSLSYLETWKVIDLLNEAFGNLGWDSETVEMEQLPGTDMPTYRSRVRIKALVKIADGQYISVTKEGCGWGSDKYKGQNHELAVKEAESDALKRAAMKFGKRLGLALYDRTQEFVTDDETAPTQQPKDSPKPSTGLTGNDTRGTATVASSTPTTVQATKSTRETINKLISQTSKVILDKKVASQEFLVAMLTQYKVRSKDELTDPQAEELLNKLREMLK